MDAARSALEARNAAMREQVDGLLDRFNQQPRQLQEAQAAAASTTATVTSRDGSVTVTVDSSGALANLEFASSSFQRSDPKQVARTVIETVRAATLEVKQQMTAPNVPDDRRTCRAWWRSSRARLR